ncbi:MAG: hypothetical protein AAB870_02355, partial [Patescibacteria group bacterium]
FMSEKREHPAVSDIPVVVFTNFGQREEIKRALELGAIGYLLKANHSLNEIVEEIKICVQKGKCRIDQPT